MHGRSPSIGIPCGSVDERLEQRDLCGIGVLIFVHKDPGKALPVIPAGARVCLEKPQGLDLQVVQVEHAQGPEPLLVGQKTWKQGVPEDLPVPVREGGRLEPGEVFHQPAATPQAFPRIGHDLLSQERGVHLGTQGKVLWQIGAGSLISQDLQTETVECGGLEILGLSILAIKPTPETARALEAEARERILREADEAIYARRNAAVEQERSIKENELNTEIAVENKKRQIRETQMEAEKAIQQKKREIAEAEVVADIAIEERKKELVALSTANAREEADSKAYAIAAVMKAFAETDAKTLNALASVQMEPGQLVAMAFKELAESADKIGTLNISPELLRELLKRGSAKR